MTSVVTAQNEMENKFKELEKKFVALSESTSNGIQPLRVMLLSILEVETVKTLSKWKFGISVDVARDSNGGYQWKTADMSGHVPTRAAAVILEVRLWGGPGTQTYQNNLYEFRIPGNRCVK